MVHSSSQGIGRLLMIMDLEQRLSRVVGTLGQLFNAVEQSDAAPTPVVLDAWKTALGGVESTLAEWEELRRQ